MLPSVHCMITSWNLSASVAKCEDTPSKPSKLHFDFVWFNWATRPLVLLCRSRDAIRVGLIEQPPEAFDFKWRGRAEVASSTKVMPGHLPFAIHACYQQQIAEVVVVQKPKGSHFLEVHGVASQKDQQL